MMDFIQLFHQQNNCLSLDSNTPGILVLCVLLSAPMPGVHKKFPVLPGILLSGDTNYGGPPQS
jgi:hypothetical protein